MSIPPPPEFLLPEPDAAYRLSAAERAKVRPEFDADALERLLAAVVPEVRPMLLRGFQWPEAGQPVSHIVKRGDASLTPLLDEVWAPYWDLLPEEMINLEDKDFPGRELARERRRARDRDGVDRRG